MHYTDLISTYIHNNTRFVEVVVTKASINRNDVVVNFDHTLNNKREKITGHRIPILYLIGYIWECKQDVDF